MDRKKLLKKEYLEHKPDMGVFIYESPTKQYIGWAKDLKAMLNKCNFTLELGSHVNKELQKSYNDSGKSLKGRVLEVLDYDEDESKKDYSDDLEALLQMWLEKIPEAKRI